MTDTITPEPTADDYRAAEKVLRAARFGGFRGGYADEADWCKEEAARLEAESARETSVETLARALAENFTDSTRWNWLTVSRAAHAFFAADGRLLPEGGTVLTYDEGTLHRVYAALGNAGLSHRVAEDAVNEMQNLGILFRERTPNESQSGLDFDVPPAVSVPDSGDYCQHPDCPDTNWHGKNRKHMRGSRCPSVPVPDSGPDGTPEKPWPTWQDVPEGVRYQSRDEHGGVVGSWWWWNQKGIRYTENGCGHPRASKTSEERMVNHYAPFVRVDGDKA